MISCMGNGKKGDGKCGFFLMDGKTFKPVGDWVKKSGQQTFKPIDRMRESQKYRQRDPCMVVRGYMTIEQRLYDNVARVTALKNPITVGKRSVKNILHNNSHHDL